jgi:hypothetical protein
MEPVFADARNEWEEPDEGDMLREPEMFFSFLAFLY